MPTPNNTTAQLDPTTLPDDQIRALMAEVETAVNTAIEPIVARYRGQPTCACCVGRAVSLALVAPLGVHAAAFLDPTDPLDTYGFLKLIVSSIALGASLRAASAVGGHA